jgi:hypothetical protein
MLQAGQGLRLDMTLHRNRDDRYGLSARRLAVSKLRCETAHTSRISLIV